MGGTRQRLRGSGEEALGLFLGFLFSFFLFQGLDRFLLGFFFAVGTFTHRSLLVDPLWVAIPPTSGRVGVRLPIRHVIGFRRN